METNSNIKRMSTMLFVATMIMSLLQMGNNAITAAIASFAEAFPDYSLTAIQSLTNFGPLVSVVAALTVHSLVKKTSVKTVAIMACFVMGIFGIAPYFVMNFAFWTICCGIKGLGCGWIIGLASAIATRYFRGTATDSLMGFDTTMKNVGSVIMSALAGFLCAASFKMTWLVYLCAIPVGIILIFLMPNQTKLDEIEESLEKVEVEANAKLEVTGNSIFWTAMVLGFYLFFHTHSMNVAVNIAEQGIGTPANTGLVLSTFTIAGAVSGVFYPILQRFLKQYMGAVGILIAACGLFLHGLGTSLSMLYVAAAVSGVGMTCTTATLFTRACMASKPANRVFVSGLCTVGLNMGLFCNPYLINPVTANLFAEATASNRYKLSTILLVCLAIVAAIKVTAETKKEKAAA